MKSLLKKLKVYGDLLPIEEFNVVAVDPLADETELLQKLNISPEKCIYTGLYWVFQDELIFLDLWSTNTSRAFAKFYIKPDEKNGKSFFIETTVCPLNTAVVRNVLQNLKTWYEKNNTIINQMTSDSNSVIISESDLGIITNEI